MSHIPHALRYLRRVRSKPIVLIKTIALWHEQDTTTQQKIAVTVPILGAKNTWSYGVTQG